MAIDPGTISAAPTPFTARAAIICSGVSAAAQASDPPTKTRMPSEKMRAMPKRSPIAPPTSTSEDNDRR